MKAKVRSKPMTKAPKGKRSKANTLEAKVEAMDARCPFRTCYVCERESRDLMMVPPMKYRHESCCPGSPEWLDYYERLAASKKHLQGNLLYKHHKRVT